jgi:hypothetical protein
MTGLSWKGLELSRSLSHGFESRLNRCMACARNPCRIPDPRLIKGLQCLPTIMHTYSVALRISGRDLDVAEVTAKLRLKPTQIRIIGQPRSPNSVWSQSLWEYQIRPGKEKPAWSSLEDGLRNALSVFVTRKKILRRYQRHFRVFL